MRACAWRLTRRCCSGTVRRVAGSLLVGGPEVADVIGAIVGGDVPAAQRRSRAAELLGLSEAMVDAALAYYAEFTDEIDAALTERARVAEEAEAAWVRRQALLEM